MTTDLTPDRNDPLRALDAVEPPDRWDDVVSRSTEGELLELTPVAARRSMPRPLLAAAAVLAVVVLAAGVFALARGDDGPQNLATESAAGLVATPTIWNSTWELVALERNGEPWDVGPNGETWPHLNTSDLDTGAISYQACNQGGGKATVEDDRLVVTDFAMTEMYCANSDETYDNLDPTLMDQEEFVTDLLMDRPTIVIDAHEDDGTSGGWTTEASNTGGFRQPTEGIGDRLTLTTANGSATFERTEIGGPIEGGTDGDDPTAIWGRMWEVSGLTSEGKTKFVAIPVDGSPLTMDASSTGRLSFITGCNGAGGQFDLVEDRLLVVEIGPTTAMGCEQALMDQDAWIQAFLEAEPTVTIVGDHLTLVTDQATIEFEADVFAVIGERVPPMAPEDPDGSVSSPSQGPGGPIDDGVPGSNSPQGPVETVPPSTPQGFFDAIWDRKWTVVKITDSGQERAMVNPTDGNPLTFDANRSSYGSAIFNGCNGAGGTFESDGTRLMMTKELDTSTAGRCASDALMAQEAWLQAFLAAGPSFVVDGDDLTLTTDRATIDLVGS